MIIEFLPQEEQPEELLAYLGVSKSSAGGCDLRFCLMEIADGCAPGIEVYERAALVHGSTAARVVRDGQRALLRAYRKRPREWKEIFPRLEMDVNQVGLTLFLRHAGAWLCRNRIGYFYMGRVRHRVPVTGWEENS